MTFEERNAAWEGSRRYFVQLQSRGGPRIWAVEVRGNQILTEWGLYDGAQQNAIETAQGVNKGKKNELSPEQYALYLGREKARKKNWEGYREINLDGSFKDLVLAEVNFDDPPKNLCFWKPDNGLDSKKLQAKAAAKEVWYVRKFDGHSFVLWFDSKGEPFFTSRRMLRQHDDEQGSQYTYNDRFAHIIEAARKLDLPPRSAILGEIVVYDDAGVELKHLVESYAKSLTPKALEDMKTSGRLPFFSVWDVAFMGGVPLCTEAPMKDRYELIYKHFKAPPFQPVTVVTPGQFAGYEQPDQFRELAKTWKWEGFICVDPEGVMGDRAFNFKGKPDRPAAVVAKVKPEFEDDFIVYFDPEKGYGERSTKGRYGANGIKSVALYQLNSKGEMVYIANCSSGMTEELKSQGFPEKFPQVWRVFYTKRRYQSQGDKTNALDFPRVDEDRGIVRTDKKLEECVNPLL